MKLALIRHAEAVVLGERGTATDFDRMLTEHGRKQSADLAKALHRVGCLPGLILSSPLVRAWQTAEILAATLTPGKEPMHCNRLAIGERRYKKLTREVAEFRCDVTFLVGHMPDLSEYASWLLGAEEESIAFDKAAAALIKFSGAPDRKSGQLKWLVPPAWFMTEEVPPPHEVQS